MYSTKHVFVVLINSILWVYVYICITTWFWDSISNAITMEGWQFIEPVKSETEIWPSDTTRRKFVHSVGVGDKDDFSTNILQQKRQQNLQRISEHKVLKNFMLRNPVSFSFIYIDKWYFSEIALKKQRERDTLKWIY